VGEIGRVNQHIGIRCFANLEDKKHEHFGTENFEIPTEGKLYFGAQLTSSRQNKGSGISMVKTPKQP
jgi:hypothetical protein